MENAEKEKEKKTKLQIVMSESQFGDCQKIINMAMALFMKDGSNWKRGDVVHRVFKEFAAVKNLIQSPTSEVEYIEMYGQSETLQYIDSLIRRYEKSPDPMIGRELWGILDEISPKHECKTLGCIIEEIRRILF